MHNETWRPVSGHPHYEVSDLGRVRSINREPMMPRWYQQDISRSLTSLIVLVVLIVTATLTYYRGLYGLMASVAYFGGIAYLIALYLTMRRQWPRLIHYLRTLWRQSY